MTTETTDEQRAAISAVKAERERDKVEAMREYQADRLAAQANLARLGALRLARESAQATAAANALQTAGAKHIYLAGRPGDQETALRSAGVRDFVFAGGDALATLKKAYEGFGLVGLS